MANEPVSSRQSADVDGLMAAGLARGMSYEAAGALANRSSKTVQRRMAEPEFVALVDALRAERVSAVTGRLGELSLRAAQVFEDAMEGDQPIKIRVAAASAVLRHQRDYHRETVLERRIQEFEALGAEMRSILASSGGNEP